MEWGDPRSGIGARELPCRRPIAVALLTALAPAVGRPLKPFPDWKP